MTDQEKLARAIRALEHIQNLQDWVWARTGKRNAATAADAAAIAEHALAEIRPPK